jgi:hypothetical protein
LRANSGSAPTVYVANGCTIRGNLRAGGTIQFQAGFVLQGSAYVLGNVASGGTGTPGYLMSGPDPSKLYYRASWGALYAAQPLDSADSGNLRLEDVVLAPSPDNPVGVFYHLGDVEMRDNVVPSRAQLLWAAI